VGGFDSVSCPLMGYYVLVFLATFLVDLIPFVGPPAWTAMVFLQMWFGLNVWWVLVIGVVGSTLGRYVYSLYIPLLSARFIKVGKNEDLQFIGNKLAGTGWKVQAFVLLYTMMPLPSTPLFTAAGIARIRPVQVLPAFFVGKFISDMAMVFAGEYAAENIGTITAGVLSFRSISGTVLGILLVCFFLFIDWRKFLQEKKLRLNFRIWK
jgi:membrane protein YqaA with SNARE-associated domain